MEQTVSAEGLSLDSTPPRASMKLTANFGRAQVIWRWSPVPLITASLIDQQCDLKYLWVLLTAINWIRVTLLTTARAEQRLTRTE